MSKIEHKDLSRGVKLTVDHVYDTIESAVTEINNSNIESNQLKTPKGSFRLNWHLPYVTSDFFSFTEDPGLRPFGIPFCLYPTQDVLNVAPGTPFTYDIDKNTTEVILSEMQLSFSQRGEGASLMSHFHNEAAPTPLPGDSPDSDKLNFRDTIEAYNLSVAIVEKQQKIFVKDEILRPEREVFSVEIPADAFIGKSFRFNPYSVSNINKVINPYKTYVFYLYCDGLYDRANTAKFISYVLSSISISLKFKTPLIARDVDDRPATEVVNIPLKHQGTKESPSVFVGTPAPGSSILAQGTEGVSTALYEIDQVFRKKMKGGYTEFSESPPNQELADDACYEIIALPLFGNIRKGGISGFNFFEQAYAGSTPTIPNPEEVLGDRRIWPIKFPFVVHHVVLAWNWMRWVDDAGNEADRVHGGMTVDLEVGIGTGIMADDVGYHEIAKLSLVDPNNSVTWENTLLDRVRIHDLSLNDAVKRDWELHYVPLNFSVFIGKGIYPQGSPFYCGKARTPTESRSGIPVIGGQEQFIEVRMKVTKGVGLNNDRILTGYGGHFVYLIGKKHLVK